MTDISNCLPALTIYDSGMPTSSNTYNLSASIWFLGALAPIVLAGLMSVGSGRAVFLPCFSDPLPETCSMRLQLGMDCPGCGLTRSFIHLSHGEFASAAKVHPFGPALYCFALLQLPLSLCHFLRIEHRALVLATRWNLYSIVVLAVLMLIRWVVLLASGQLS